MANENDKLWSCEYAYIDADGLVFDDCRVIVNGKSIDEALRKARKKLNDKFIICKWKRYRIYDIGICNENIW